MEVVNRKVENDLLDNKWLQVLLIIEVSSLVQKEGMFLRIEFKSKKLGNKTQSRT